MLLVPKANLVPLDMSVDQALKYIISMEVAAPPLPGVILPATVGLPDNRN